MRALLAVVALTAACDHALPSRCILDGAELLGPVERGPECSVTFDGSGSVTGVIDLHGEGLKLFFADGCPTGVRRVLRVAPEWSEVFTQRERQVTVDALVSEWLASAATPTDEAQVLQQKVKEYLGS